jgi:serine/threonine-protein kinase
VISEGQTLDGTYHLRRLVSEGGMGAVYEATHARLAGRYAIKVLLRSLADNVDAQALFDREARITSLLQHPNVVQVIDHNTTDDGTAYLVMEYLSGESLAGRLARVGALPVPEVVDIVDQIAAGLAAAHAHGIVHRDLKPDNVFLVPIEGRDSDLVKILDFGISKANWGMEPMDKGIFGTPEYMAPEQLEGRAADVDNASDQFALAVIAYELLTACNPGMASRVLAPTGLPGQLDSVLARALARSNDDRFPTVMDFAAAFRAAALPPPVVLVTPMPVFAAEVAARAPRRSRPPSWGRRVGLSVAAGLAATLFFGVKPPASVSGSRPAVSVAPSVAEPSVVEPSVAEPSVAEPLAPEPPAPIMATTDAPEVDARRLEHRPTASRARTARRVYASPAVHTRSAPAPAPQLAVDEDATLPMSETVGAY